MNQISRGEPQITEGVMSQAIPSVMTIENLAIYTQISPDWIYHNIQKIPHFRLGRIVRFHKEVIDAWIKGEVSPPSEVHDDESIRREAKSILSATSRRRRSNVD